MHAIVPIRALQGLAHTPSQRFAVSRQACDILFEDAETCLAMDHAEALDIADQLKEEITETLGATLGSKLPDDFFNRILSRCLGLVTITKTAVQPVAH